MKTVLRIQLNPTPEQGERLRALQTGFSQVCNALAPVVQQTRIWNRVALHHLAYRSLRQRFPAMGSQMVCNAIYAVSRSCRLVFQSPQSPFNLERLGDRPLPLIQFHERAPVFFDRHTLSLKDGSLSMFTPGGRAHFDVTLQSDEFIAHKLREAVLVSRDADAFDLVFHLESVPAERTAARPDSWPDQAPGQAIPLPQYVKVEPLPL